MERLEAYYNDRERQYTPEIMRDIERTFQLMVLDQLWKEHLSHMDHLKEGIGLRGYGQKNPLIEYRKEGFDLFSGMIERMKSMAIERVMKVQIVEEEERPTLEQKRHEEPEQMQMTHGGGSSEGSGNPDQATVRRHGEKVGRNDPCPCGSGKKFKKCHGA
jgi:preprotein translocase subunit SecA